MKEILRNAEDKLNKKGYCVANMLAPYSDSYEVYNGDMQVVIDHLSLAQLADLAELL